MNNIDTLWATDQGMFALGILAIAFILLIVAYLTEFHLVFVIIDAIAWGVAVTTIGAVLGIWTLPGFLDFFNLMDIAETVK